MAFKNPSTGEYLRIERVTFDGEYCSNVDYRTYANQTHRESGDTDFLHSKLGSVNSGLLQIEFAKMANPELSIIDNIKTAAYNAIKADTFEISNWQDC